MTDIEGIRLSALHQACHDFKGNGHDEQIIHRAGLYEAFLTGGAAVALAYAREGQTKVDVQITPGLTREQVEKLAAKYESEAKPSWSP